MPYSTLKDKKTELIRKARDGSVFISNYSATGITTLSTGGTNEVQTVTITGTPTGGTFSLSYGGQTASGIAYNAAASAVQTALNALTSIGASGVTVGGGPAPATPFTVTFSGTSLAGTDVATMTAVGSFTGGTTPAIAVTTTTPGVAVDLATLPTGYTDLGWITSDGVTYGRATEVSDVTSFGSVQPTRSDVTSDTITMSVVAQQTNLMTLGLYTGADTSALTASITTGEFSISKPSIPGFRYYRVLGLFVDRDDSGREIYMARYMPRARITEWAEQQMSDGGDPVTYSMTFTGYEDSTVGYSHRWLFAGPGWRALLTNMGITAA